MTKTQQKEARRLVLMTAIFNFLVSLQMFFGLKIIPPGVVGGGLLASAIFLAIVAFAFSRNQEKEILKAG